jgi:hypothetical protein
MIIGKYELSSENYAKEDEVWISKVDDGEGSIFKKEELFKQLEAVIDKFYEENF